MFGQYMPNVGASSGDAYQVDRSCDMEEDVVHCWARILPTSKPSHSIRAQLVAHLIFCLRLHGDAEHLRARTAFCFLCGGASGAGRTACCTLARLWT